jgi:hypothetical protein
VCQQGALTYVEKQEERAEAAAEKHGEMEIGLESLVKRYGLKSVIDIVARMAKSSH